MAQDEKMAFREDVFYLVYLPNSDTPKYIYWWFVVYVWLFSWLIYTSYTILFEHYKQIIYPDVIY